MFRSIYSMISEKSSCGLTDSQVALLIMVSTLLYTDWNNTVEMVVYYTMLQSAITAH